MARTLLARMTARFDPLLAQAVIAAALSFSHIHDIAVAAGQTGWKAWAYPVSVDVLMVMAWKQIRTAGPKGAAWCWFILSLAASLGANVGTAGVLDLDAPPTWLRVVVAGWPVAAFLGGSLLVHSRKAHTQPEAPSEPAVEPFAEAVEEESGALEIAPQRPVLITYGEAADVAGVAVVTIRGAVRGPRARLTKHETSDGPRVDLAEVRRTYNVRPMGA